MVDVECQTCLTTPMKKSVAIQLFGSSTKLATALGISKQAVSGWPDVLTSRQTNEVLGAAIRLGVFQIIPAKLFETASEEIPITQSSPPSRPTCEETTDE